MSGVLVRLDAYNRVALPKDVVDKLGLTGTVVLVIWGTISASIPFRKIRLSGSMEALPPRNHSERCDEGRKNWRWKRLLQR